MSFIKWIVGGGIGALVGAVAYLAIEHFVGGQLPTYVRECGAIIIGVLAGIGTRNAASSDRINFGRGAVAMVLALLCIVGAKCAYAEILMARQGNAAEPVVIATDKKAGDDEPLDEGADPVVLVSEPFEEISPDAWRRPSVSGNSVKFRDVRWDAVWFVLAGFIAYQLGKSPRRKPTVGEDAGASKPPPASEPPADAANG